MKSVRSIRMLIFTLAFLLALAPLSSALATPPEFYIGTFYGSATFDCGSFPLLFELQVTSKASNHYDQNGEFRMYLERVQEQISTYTNLDTEASISSSIGAGIVHIITEQDGTVAINGVLNILTIPGQGVIVHDVGRLVFDLSTFELLFSAGQSTIHGPGGSLDALCAALE